MKPPVAIDFVGWLLGGFFAAFGMAVKDLSSAMAGLVLMIVVTLSVIYGRKRS